MTAHISRYHKDEAIKIKDKKAAEKLEKEKDETLIECEVDIKTVDNKVEGLKM